MFAALMIGHRLDDDGVEIDDELRPDRILDQPIAQPHLDMEKRSRYSAATAVLSRAVSTSSTSNAAVSATP